MDHRITEILKLEEENILTFYDAFQNFDKNNDEFIDENEYKNIVESLNLQYDPKVFQEILNKYCNNSDKINFSHFCSLMKDITSDKNFDQNLHNSFNLFDKNHDGLISFSELKKILTLLDPKIDQNQMSEINELFNKSVPSGSMNLDEFRDFFYDKLKISSINIYTVR